MHSCQLVVHLVLLLLCALPGSLAATAGIATAITSFAVPKSPSGMFYNEQDDILWVLCGTNTNGDHYLYGYTLAGVQKCFITIPASAGMSRVDGFHIYAGKAYLADSQGPIYASTTGMLGGSVYGMMWSNPCGCSAGSCTTPTATWSPSVTTKIVINPLVASIGDGGGIDSYFRNSGVMVVGNFLYAINGVHPVNQNVFDKYYPKSLVKVSLSDTAAGGATAVAKWSFDASTLGRQVDMEGLDCGDDNCTRYIYTSDEYNYVYKLDLSVSTPSLAVVHEWDLRSIVGSTIPVDKGLEAIAYASKTGYWYVGVQQTAMVHVVSLLDTLSSSPSLGPSSTAAPATSSPPSSSGQVSAGIAIAPHSLLVLMGGALVAVAVALAC